MRALLLLPLLAGCASAMHETVTGNEVAVSVTNVWNVNQAQEYADAHCAKYGKVARPSTNQGDYSFSFDCIKP